MMKKRFFLIKGGKVAEVIPNIILGIDPTANIIRKTSTGVEIEISSNKKAEIEKLLSKWSASYHFKFYLLQ